MYALLMQGSFTGPRIFWSGSSLRTEATGYGLVLYITTLRCSVFGWMVVGKCDNACMFAWLCTSIRVKFLPLSSGCNEFPIHVVFSKFLLVNKVLLLLQVFFAQLMLADMNKDLKGLRSFTQLCELFRDSLMVIEVDSMV